MIAAVIVYLVFEIGLIVWVANQIGTSWSLMIMAGTAILGGWLMGVEARQSTAAYRKLRAEGETPRGELLDVLLIMAGGILLFLPGYIGDVLGIFAIAPFTRATLRKAVSALIERWMRSRGVDVTRLKVAADPTSVIVGETVLDSPESSTDPRANPPARHQDAKIVIRGEIEP